jgi:RNA polymerase sigma factor (sigma-70 family)
LVTFDDAVSQAPASPDEVIALDEALQRLAGLSPRQALMVETRFFGGLSVAETAELLEVSAITVERDWRAARAWLSRELRSVG